MPKPQRFFRLYTLSFTSLIMLPVTRFKSTFCCLLFAMSPFSYWAQSDCWSFMIGDNGLDKIKTLAVSPSGNIWIAGVYEGTIDFDPGAGTQVLSSSTFSENFIAAYDTEGLLRHVAALPGLQVLDMRTDSSENVYLTGFYSGLVDADPGSGNDSLPLFGGTNIFILSLDSGGNYRWGKGYGSAGPDEGSHLSVDASGKVWLAGSYFFSLTMDTENTATDLNSQGASDVFVARFDPNNGIPDWAVSFGGTGFEASSRVAAGPETDQGAWLSFGFENLVDMVGPNDSFPLTSKGETDVAIARLDSSGDVIQAWSIGGPGRDSPSGIAVDRFNQLFLTGIYRDSIDTDPGSGTQTLTSKGESDIFLISHTPTGLFQSSSSAGGPNFDTPRSLSLIGRNFSNTKVIVAGEFDTNIEVGSGSSDPPTSLTSNGFIDSYLAWYNPATGALEGVKQFGGLEADAEILARADQFFLDLGTTFDLLQAKVVITGNSSGSLNLNPTPSPACPDAMTWTASPGNFDFYVAKYPLFADSSTTSLKGSLAALPMRIFPNPAKAFLALEWPDYARPNSALQITILDLSGKQLYQESLPVRPVYRVSIAEIPQGMYLLKAVDESGRFYVDRFIKWD